MDATICKVCFCVGNGMVPINGEFVCEDCLSLTEAKEEVIRLAAAEAERDDANRRFNEMNTPTGREIELAHDLAECRRLLRDVCGVIERNGERSDDGCFIRVSFRKDWYDEAAKAGGCDGV